MNNYQKWFQQIQKDNAAFKKANKQRKRIIIAQDIIKALEVELFNASGRSGYVDVESYDYDTNVMIPEGRKRDDAVWNNENNKDLRDTFLQNGPKCDVCAKGAIFVCTVMRRDQVSTEQFRGIAFDQGDSLSTALSGIFSEQQLNLIENHYELGRVDFHKDSVFSKYERGAKRLIAIMKNIIKNQGTFIPENEVVSNG